MTSTVNILMRTCVDGIRNTLVERVLRHEERVRGEREGHRAIAVHRIILVGASRRTRVQTL